MRPISPNILSILVLVCLKGFAPAGDTDTVRGVALSGDGKLVLTGSYDKTAVLWEAASGKKLQTFQGHTDVLSSVALSGDGKLVLTGSGSKDRTAILWEAASGKKVQTF